MNRKSRMSRKNRKARKDKVWGGDDLHLHAARAPHPDNLAPVSENGKWISKIRNSISNFGRMFLNFREKLLERIDDLSRNKLDCILFMVVALVVTLMLLGAR